MNWNNISIKQAKEIKNLLSNDNLDDFEYVAGIMSIVTGNPIDTYYDMVVDEFLTATKEATEFLKSKPIPRLEEEIVIDDVTYCLCLNIGKMKAGQYIDLNQILSKEPENLSRILTTLYIPKGKSYGEDYDPSELINTFNDKFPFEVAMGASSFFELAFLSLTKASLTSSLRKLRKSMKKEKSQEKKALIAEGIQKIEKKLMLLKDGCKQLAMSPTLQN